jgi:predicted cation transporter
MEPPTVTDLGLLAVILMVFILPLLFKKIGANLEAFLLLMGILAVTVSGLWSPSLLQLVITDPVRSGVVPAVLVAGVIFLYGKSHLQKGMTWILDRVTLKLAVFLIVVFLGLISSLITAIITALLLVELLAAMPLHQETRKRVLIVACFSIGMGMVLTPVGEPLALVAETQLQGPPYYAGFFFIFDLLAIYIIPGCLAMGLLAAFIVHKSGTLCQDHCFLGQETLREVLIRGARIYLFVMALILLGNGLEPLIDKYLVQVPPQILYWLNMLSAVLDNATLTAAEITPDMSSEQIKAMLMALLISGGMLIPGNIANIVSAGKLNISSNEWSRMAVPLGLALLVIYYIWIFYLPFYVQFNL